MQISVWLWQFSKDYGQGNVPDDDGRLPVAEYWGKTNDGLTWQGAFDNHLAEFNGAADVARADRQIYAPQGIGFVPWGVVQGVSRTGTDIAAQEGALAAQIAKAAAGPGEAVRYIVDLEPYYHGGATPQFWRNDLGAGPDHVRRYIDAYVAGGGQELWVAPDARAPHLEPVSFGTWVASPVVRMVCPQVYFTDFQRPARTALDAALVTLAAYRVGPERIHAALPANAEPGPLVDAVRYAHERGCAGVSFWRRGSFRADSLEALAALADPWADAPPSVDVEAVREQGRQEGYRQAARYFEGRLGLVRTQVEAVRAEAAKYAEAPPPRG